MLLVCSLSVGKGSIFVEFVSVEDAKKFISSEKIQFNGNDLIVEWKLVSYNTYTHIKSILWCCDWTLI